MWAESTLTIAFRGLLVFHRVERKGRNWVDIGFLYGIPDHVLRINIIRNCVLETILHPKKKHITPRRPLWRLVVDNPVGGGTSIKTSGLFDRKTYPPETDFRWIMDLEDKEFYGKDLTEKLNTRLLTPILRIPHGVFYTRLKSGELQRREGGGGYQDFGCVAAVVGCDIPLLGGGAKLIHDASGETILNFEAGTNVIYEFAYTPPDGQPPPEKYHSERQDETCASAATQATDAGQPAVSVHSQAEARPHEPADAQAHDETEKYTQRDEHEDHFHYYYKLFLDPDIKRYSFYPKKLDYSGTSLEPPAPYPALCGAIRLGKRKETLREA